MSNIEAAFGLPSCPRCGEAPGDPCRTPSWRTTRPHKERLASSAPEARAEAPSPAVGNLTATPDGVSQEAESETEKGK